ncbi:GFA family protein [Methylomonas sp. LL1]|uniref:GFA family protein n=1 Tax=Methylomonas sp. LL1 TaxID=2785785 RepID=UPI001E5CC73D|nr:GFA family protein [Methylomonas sp. LL1]
MARPVLGARPLFRFLLPGGFMTITFKGGCLCGAVKYQVSGNPERFYHCHCSRCRKSSGTGHATNLFLANADLAFTAGESLVKQFKVPDAKRFTRQFCSECGSQVARFVPELNGVVVPAGSLDDEIPIKPQARIFWHSRTDWSCDGDTLPRYAEYPES